MMWAWARIRMVLVVQEMPPVPNNYVLTVPPGLH